MTILMKMSQQIVGTFQKEEETIKLRLPEYFDFGLTPSRAKKVLEKELKVEYGDKWSDVSSKRSINHYTKFVFSLNTSTDITNLGQFMDLMPSKNVRNILICIIKRQGRKQHQSNRWIIEVLQFWCVMTYETYSCYNSTELTNYICWCNWKP